MNLEIGSSSVARYPRLPEVASPEARVEIALKLPNIKKMFSPYKHKVARAIGNKNIQKDLNKVIQDKEFHNVAQDIANKNTSSEERKELAKGYIEKRRLASPKKMALYTAWIVLIVLVSFIVVDLVVGGGIVTTYLDLTWENVAPWVAPAIGAVKIAGLDVLDTTQDIWSGLSGSLRSLMYEYQDSFREFMRDYPGASTKEAFLEGLKQKAGSVTAPLKAWTAEQQEIYREFNRNHPGASARDAFLEGIRLGR